MKISVASLTLPILFAGSLSLSAAVTYAADPPTPATPTAPAAAPKMAALPPPVLLANGVAAPEITAIDNAGATVKLSDLKGKVVVIDFWASWCPPCKASMPHNQEVIKKLQAAGVPVVLLAVDNSEHGTDAAARQGAFAKWVAAHPEYDALKFVYIDPKVTRVAGPAFHVTGIPTQYVIDAQGVIRYSTVGYGGPTDDLEKAVHAAVEPTPAKTSTSATATAAK